ncbi:MAG: hypothetical protein LBO80_04850 [Treponema sp.]|jgi:hypothetical protein|nr:hypothetical protein [Treponema sp.]
MDKTDFITELNKEKRRIQEALLAAGYFAYVVKFQANDGKHAPRIEIEARPGDEDDRKLLA